MWECPIYGNFYTTENEQHTPHFVFNSKRNIEYFNIMSQFYGNWQIKLNFINNSKSQFTLMVHK